MANIQFKIIESTRSAAQSVRAHRFRSFLTTLGIIIGVASVISVVSVLQVLVSILVHSSMGLERMC